MPHRILMPALSPTMTEGKLARWIKKEGDYVKSGQVIAEIETDKATMEVESADEGVLGKILVPSGTDNVKVNTLIGVLLEDGEDVTSIQTLMSAQNKSTSTKSMPVPSTLPSLMKDTTQKSKGRIFISPLARRLAKEKGIDISALQGTGPHGRIIKADIERHSQKGNTTAQQKNNKPSTPSIASDARALSDAYGIPYQAEPHSSVRKVIAKRLSESKQVVPHFYLSVECELDALLMLRRQFNATEEGLKISVNDFIIKATAVALKKCPAVNVSWTEDALIRYQRADVSVAVATESGLITPIIKDAAAKSLKTISQEMKDLAARAREGKLKPQEFQGGTISVSNLGMFGIREFSAIINPPQASILAIGAGENRAIVKDGQIKVANIMSVTMSLDHRAIDGAVGAEYLQIFKKLLEEPLMLLL